MSTYIIRHPPRSDNAFPNRNNNIIVANNKKQLRVHIAPIYTLCILKPSAAPNLHTSVCASVIIVVVTYAHITHISHVNNETKINN